MSADRLLLSALAAGAIVLAPVALAPTTGDAAAAPTKARKGGKRARPGKVVRVERNQPRVSSTARICAIVDDDLGNCTREVAVGEVGLVVDNEGNYGRAAIVSVTQVVDGCGNPVIWNIEIDQSHLTSHDYSYSSVLVIDHPINDDGRTLPPTQAPPAGRPRENVINVIDDDGDGQADLLVTSYGCDDPGVGTPSTRPGQTCTDTWIEVRDVWRHARTDAVPTCY